MRKTLFKKYLRITSAIILISFIILSFVMVIFVSNYWKSEKRNLLRRNAENVATLVSKNAISVKKDVYTLDSVRMQNFTEAFAQNIDSDIFITDCSGKFQVIAYGSGGDFDGTKPISPQIMQKALNGFYSGEGTLNGVYSRSHNIVGVPIRVRSDDGMAEIGAVFAAYNSASFHTFLLEIVRNLLLAAVAAFLISFCMVWIFSYKLVQPLRRMAYAARCFGKGDFSVRVPVTSSDEIGQLAAAFNNMADSLTSSESASRNFIANVSHELKTPMTTIAGFIDGILDGTIPQEKEKHYLTIVSQEVKRLSRLVRTMLDLSRIDSGSLKLHPARFDLTNTILICLLSFEQKIEAKHIEVRGLEHTENLFVDGDPDMLHQVVYNLIDNAVKFTNEGGYLSIHIAESGDRVTVSIENSGAGIEPDELPLIFDRFYKTDKSRSQDKNGMGLGLYLIKTIVRLHGGDISAASEQNKYTRFEFWIPKKIEQPHAGQSKLVETTAGNPPNPKQKKDNI
jgi:signal transduction histidine kinase